MQSIPDHDEAAAGSWFAFHPLAPEDRVVVDQMRTLAEPNKGKLRGVAARSPFDAIMARVVVPEDVTFHRDTVGGIGGWWCKPLDGPQGSAILHAHGGWFNWGTADAFRHFVGHIARSAGVNAFIPDYRLAPEDPFPAALDDLHACYRGLLNSGAQSVALTGDSAGGNLVLSLLASMTGPTPNRSTVAAVAISPVTDLAMTGPSWHSRANADPNFVWDQAAGLIHSYLQGHDPADPNASPLYGNLAGLPPVRVHVGDAEVLLDDSLRYVERAVAAGVDASVDVWEGMPHGFVGGVGRLRAAGQALHAIGAFLSGCFRDVRNPKGRK